jgi:ATP-dependent DNA helicase RecQ
MRPVVEKAGRGKSKKIPLGEGGPVDEALLDRLRAWRREESASQSVPAYVILHDASLVEIARRKPAGPAELSGIPGIGVKKLERYGPALLALVAGEGE